MTPEQKLAQLNIKSTLLSLELRKAIAKNKGREDLSKDMQDLVDNLCQALDIFEDTMAENSLLTKRNFHLESKNLELVEQMAQIKLNYKIESL